MPLPEASDREKIHTRVIAMKAYARSDGLFDVDAHLVDKKPFAFPRVASAQPVTAGEPLHDLWVRLTVDSELVVRSIVASSEVTPYELCKQAEKTLAVLIGATIGPGWSSRVKAHLRGTASCTHLMEMLMPIATTALQAVRGVRRKGSAGVKAADVVVNVDSCYAYASDREVIRTYWPQHYRPKESPACDLGTEGDGRSTPGAIGSNSNPS